MLAGRGRYVLLICIAYLIIQGPLINILLNTEKLSTSFICLARVSYLFFDQSVRNAARPMIDFVRTVQAMMEQLQALLKIFEKLIDMLTVLIDFIQFLLGKCTEVGERVGGWIY